ncbi:hypothetical protein PPYR_03809 [Photinus pyralis]|uniref:Uncharacterized protein n=1 Tax=Photinus pyralis TaxID=7054 RepID=A0A1Y1NFT0_PHOPY|nr:general odorant-binding protein 56d-like [Photinus pyralis]XP_031338295.1 general odorant-binding protein 56d-like [Photinus pyralis]KAB0800262.1 hypothetical protein PPYR_06002 [Photinus pyralis]KAB0801623.1 hypothetical protein PPYR_03809 [Photinus pyralis]
MKILIVSFVGTLFSASLLLAQEEMKEKDEMGAIMSCINSDENSFAAGNYTQNTIFDDQESKCFYACVMEGQNHMVNGSINADMIKYHLGNESEQAVDTCQKYGHRGGKDKCEIAYRFQVCLRRNNGTDDGAC